MSRQEIILECSKRVAVGSRAAVKLRAAGNIPAILYGYSKAQSVQVNNEQFRRAFRTISENVVIDLNVEGKHHHAIIKEYSVNPLTGEIIHLDFFEIERGKVLKTHVRIHTTGSSQGVRQGGVLEQPIHELEIECLPKDLPQDITVDITKLDIGDSIRVNEITLPEGVKVLSNAEQVLVHVDSPRVEVTTETEQADDTGEEAKESEEQEEE